MKTESVIGWVAASLIVGFVIGVAFGIYKSGTIVDPHQSHGAAAVNARQEEAIQALLEQAGQNPGDSTVWIQLGHHYFDANLPDKAIEAYEKALAIEPQNADVWTDLGVMYRRSGNPEKAVESFDRAMEIDSVHEISRFNKGIVLFHDLKDEKGALKAWESLLSINPDAKTPGGQMVRELVNQIKKNQQDPK
jgi:cytochrome c-type biogenesis protein CcmH/NrfG